MMCGLLLATLIGCTQHGAEYIEKKAKLEARNAQQDCETNVAAGDNRFRGWHTQGAPYIPVLEIYRVPQKPSDQPLVDLVEQYGLLPMDDTGDVVHGKLHSEYIGAAMKYATEYNTHLIKLLKIPLDEIKVGEKK